MMFFYKLNVIKSVIYTIAITKIAQASMDTVLFYLHKTLIISAF